MAQQDPAIYREFQEYGAGKAKLYARIADEVPEEARTPGYQEDIDEFERLSHNHDIIDYRIVDTRHTFAQGNSIRSMADETGLVDFYRQAYSQASGVGQDPIQVAVEETPRLVEALLAQCAKNAACQARYPQAVDLWPAARRELARKPIRLKAGALGEVLVDEALLLRIVRQVISDGGSSGLAFTPGSLPGVLQDVIDRGGPWLDKEIAPLLAAQDPFCLGYVSDCLKKMRLSAGVYLSMMCHDILPFAGPPEAASDPMFARVFTARADPEVCSRWNVGEAIDVGAPVDWDVPTLAFVGRFPPYTRLADVRLAVSALPNGSVLVDPGGADNVLPRTECALTLRTAWLYNPTGSVESPPCLRTERIQWNLN